ncbi:hypothetical protein [Photorhabdus luminescens]|uniref:Uncharacterized protein n=1 Tax=Photorhabdus luminescens subsp. mexicana TaxID=2100167 RepID=A0A4R4JQ96_PHOLU|nr:hypothetical protein [Photorhabdus luminescens]TDB55579.1 hypothetical protein C5468_02820 [Photorhabdus luminescens subsp. mexicana]
MEMREKLQYIDKLTNAVDRNDFELFHKILNELQGNYLNVAPLMLLENINHLIYASQNIKGCFSIRHSDEADPKLWETISAVLEHLNQSSKIMQSYINKQHEKDK